MAKPGLEKEGFSDGGRALGDVKDGKLMQKVQQKTLTQGRKSNRVVPIRKREIKVNDW